MAKVEIRWRFGGEIFEPASSSLGASPQDDPASLLVDRYSRLGECFLDEVRGSFAIDLSDDGRGLRLVACDGYGNRRPTYRIVEGRLEVGEEIEALTSGRVVREAIDPLRWAEYFGHGEISGAACLVPGIRELLPGEMVVLENGRERRRRLPGPDLTRRLRLPRWEEVVEAFLERLQRAVERAVANESRVAVWLSGGLDSSPIAALAARLGCEVEGLYWSVSDRPADERAFAEAVANRSGFRLHPIPCDDAAPFSDLSTWPVHPATPEQTAYRRFHERCYARAAELGCRVVLTGFSGDALYANAARWAWTLLAAQGAGAAIDRLREVAARRGWRATLRSEVLSPLLPKRRRLRRFLPPYLTPEARERLLAAPRWPPDLERAPRPRQAERVLALLDSHGGEVERWYAARHGLEIRSPLRDPDLVDFALAVPDHVLHQGERTRPVLREAIRDLVPEEVRERRGKASFGALLDRGLEPERLAWAPGLLLDPEALWRGFVEEADVRRWAAGDLSADWDRLGYLQCLFAELWRFTRAGGELGALQRR